jgi:alpha/beta superfamily hydrolase
MPRKIESLFIAGPTGKLEALLEEPEEGSALEAALVCHPHPQGGGTMHNKVVYRMARGLRKSSCVVLRFNYRGVNLSEGEYAHGIGETDDARAALEELRARYPKLPVLAAGFSFGSRVALRLTSQQASVGRVIAVGFPTTIGEFDSVHKVRVPKLFVQSTQDEFSPRAEFSKFYAALPEPKELEWVEACDHFFKNNLDAFEGVMERAGRKRQAPNSKA